MTNINGDDYVIEDTILAGNLSALHLGTDTALMFLYEYTYAGERREKTRTLWGIDNIWHEHYDNGSYTVKVRAHHARAKTYGEWVTVGNPATEMIVLRKVKK